MKTKMTTKTVFFFRNAINCVPAGKQLGNLPRIVAAGVRASHSMMDLQIDLKASEMESTADILTSIMLPLVAPQQERKAHSLWQVGARESEV